MTDATRHSAAGSRTLGELFAEHRDARFAVFMVANVATIIFAGAVLFPAMDFVPAFVLAVAIAMALNAVGQLLVRAAIEHGWGRRDG